VFISIRKLSGMLLKGKKLEVLEIKILAQFKKLQIDKFYSREAWIQQSFKHSSIQGG
jgi:hypothetical protein